MSVAMAQDGPTAVPVSGLPPWITAADYPAAAKRAGIEGKVQFELAVNPKGRVKACTVVASSGSIELDDRTCSLMAARATFTPAIDANGNPTNSRYSSAVNWMLPQDAVIASITKLSFSIEVGVSANGLVESCKILEREGSLQPGQVAVPIAYCPAVGSRFSDDFIGRSERAPRKFVITKFIREIAR